MSNRARFFWGGAGALAPILLNLLVVDLVGVFRELAWPVVTGYAVKVLILFVIGGLWAAMHRAEVEPVKLFQMGIVAPAIILSTNNGINLRSTLSEQGGGSRAAA